MKSIVENKSGNFQKAMGTVPIATIGTVPIAY